MTKRTKRILAMMSSKPKLRKISGLPPLTYTAKEEGTLKNYRIYGQTVDGESVGDRTANLFDSRIEQGSFNSITGVSNDLTNRVRAHVNDYIYLTPGKYKISASGVEQFVIYAYDSSDIDTFNANLSNISWVNLPSTITINTSAYYKFGFRKDDDSVITPSDISNIMLNEGSTPLPYEPYGYKVPVTVEGKNLSEVNEFSNSITDTSKTLKIWVQQGKGQSFAYPDQSNIFVIEEPTTITSHITITDDNGSIRIKHNGYTRDIVIDIVHGLSYGVYSVSFNVLDYDLTTVGGIVINNIMVNKGSIALPYEPYHAPITTPIYLPEQIRKVGDEAEYVDYGEQKQYRVRKNLLQNTAISQTVNGVEFTINANGSVSCNGQATMVIYFEFNSSFTLPVGKFVLTGCPTGGGNSSYRMYIQSDNLSPQKYYTDTGNGVTIDNTNADTVYSARILIVNGYSCNNLTFYPMICPTSIEDGTYEPYIENTDLDVTLPALPTVTGTNVLSVGTVVQPGEVEVTGRIRPVPTGGGE